METVPSQEPRLSNDQWRTSSYTRQESQNNSALGFESDTPILDETIAIVKEKVWSFRAAMKAAAEALVGFGLSPSVVGYSSVPMRDDDQLAEKNDGEAALQKVINDEILSRSGHSNPPNDGVCHRRSPEESRLVQPDEDEDDCDHAFVEAGRKEKEERKSLTGTWEGDDLEEDEDHFRKEK